MILTHPRHGKGQAVRLVDVFVLGPFMVWAGGVLRADGHDVAGTLMTAAGAGTIAYNGHNYLNLRARR